jgi:hypothetical protein
MGRRAVGAELKSRHTSRTGHPSYFEQAVANLRSLPEVTDQPKATLLDAMEGEAAA